VIRLVHLLLPWLHEWRPGLAFGIKEGRPVVRIPVLRCHCGAVRPAKG